MTTSSRSSTSLRPGRYHVHLADNRGTQKDYNPLCGKCKQVGHWWKECPKKNEKEAHLAVVDENPEVESEEATFCGLVEIEPKEEMP